MADQQVQRFLGYGADLAGASAGYAAEFFQVVPPGAGGPVGAVLANVIKEFGVRSLSPRELRRVSAATAFAAERVRARLIAGFNPRTDGFFDDAESGGSSGQELLEAVLVKARDSFEERKVRHLGLFYAHLVFADYVSAATAHLALKQVERLTYRQIVLLAIVGSRGSLNMESLRRPSHVNPELEALKREEMDLHSNDLGTMGLLTGSGPWSDELSTLGKVLYDLAGLSEVSSVDVTTLEAQLNALDTGA